MFVENHYPVPLGALLALARGLVAPGFRGRQRQLGDLLARLHGADFGVAAQIADENYVIDTSSHFLAPIRSRTGLISSRRRIMKVSSEKRNIRLPSYPA